jgi:molybdopterin-containing oxidoreductase family iron-sulfur binding subunit
MSRVYLVESGFSLTGSICDVRLPIIPTRIPLIAREIAAGLEVANVKASGEQLSPSEQKFIANAVADLKKAGKNGVASAGAGASPETHALAHAINEKIGAVGSTVTLLADPAGDRPTHAAALATLAGEITGGKVSALLIIGGNPAYDAPADLKFADAIASVPFSARLGLYEDETSRVCKWHLPRAHYLEAWGDARAWDGTASIVQPLILPLYGGKSTIEVLAMLAGDEVTDGHQIVRRTWKDLVKGGDFELGFRKALEAGLLADTGYTTADAKATVKDLPALSPKPAGFFVRFDADWRAYDGRFANNAWLQETPDPLTKLVWDNAALVSKKDADQIGVKTGDMARFEVEGSSAMDLPVYVLPGQPLGVITLQMGYGRTASGNVGTGLGFNTYNVRTTKAGSYGVASRVTAAGGSYVLAATQNHHIIDELGYEARQKRIGEKGESGKIVHEARFAEYKENPRAALGAPRTIGLQLFEPPSKFNDPHAWGMAIDMNACIGCNACAVACQAENNIPVVGKHEVLNHREMNWIRIDRYFKGAPEDETIDVVYQPMMCVHCENAPCEQVCPVAATVHDSEGINTMVYNRCVGTRYCSNNCPYKVRRFNYLDYHSKPPRQDSPDTWFGMPDAQQDQTIDKIKRMVFNPDVTVRMRGVMEKCSYCVQRIHGATIAAHREGKDVVDGDVITACQQACPTQAIVFGNLNDSGSKVVALQKLPRSYGVLQAELDTRPRSTHLAKLRNPVGAEVAEGGQHKTEHHG